MNQYFKIKVGYLSQFRATSADVFMFDSQDGCHYKYININHPDLPTRQVKAATLTLGSAIINQILEPLPPPEFNFNVTVSIPEGQGIIKGMKLIFDAKMPVLVYQVHVMDTNTYLNKQYCHRAELLKKLPAANPSTAFTA